jgi:Helix-turn-helix domain
LASWRVEVHCPIMLFVDHARWGQTPGDLRRLAMIAAHARTRERFLALYEITQESSGATRVAARTGRHPQTVMGWLHAYNGHGPDALVYRRTGGRPPFAPTLGPASARSFARLNAAPQPHP